jgi:hypothetical protein
MSFLFGKPKIPPVEEIDPSEDARKLRRRIAARGGFQSTLLAGRGTKPGANIFKSNLGGTKRRVR